MENLDLTALLNTGANGALILMVWSLIQTNKSLIAEMRSRDDRLYEIIDRLLKIESAPPPGRRLD